MHRDWEILEEEGQEIKVKNVRYGFILRLSQSLAWKLLLEDFEIMYNVYDYRGKKVLDVGAGVGETSALFLAWGAEKVYAYENDGASFKYLYLNSAGRAIEPFFMTVCKNNINHVLSHPIDIAKLDCEGCEEALLYADPELIKRIPIWMVEAHSRELENRLKRLFESLGFRTRFMFRLTPEVSMFAAEFSDV